MQFRRIFVPGFALLIALAVAACGSETAASESPNNLDYSADVSSESGSSMIIDNGTIYSVEQFKTAGFKNKTQFELETLPGAIDAWYGFYNQKDFELRFYESHRAALDEGVEPARVAVGKGVAPWIKQPPIRFDAFAVIGNVVMLCELDIESCKTLIANLD